MANREDQNAFWVRESDEENHLLRMENISIKNENIRLREKNESLKRQIKALKMRISLATDFSQSEMDLKNVCVLCSVPYHPDYCYDRQNDGSKPICDVCLEIADLENNI